MNVLQVFKTYLPDNFAGIERVIWELAEGGSSRSQDHRVLTVTRTAQPQIVSVGSHLVYRAHETASVSSSSFSTDAFRLYRDLSRWADVVHFHFPWPQMDLLHLALPARLKKPTVVTYHSDIVKQRILGPIYAPVREMFLRSVQRIVATSPQYADSSPVLRRHRDKVAVVPIGIGQRQAPKAEQMTAWRARIGSGFFLFVGAARYYKGLPYLFEAARVTGLPVVVAGSFDRPTPDLPANVTLLGRIDDEAKEALLELCNAVILPSHLRSEAYGVILAEGARAGRALISCKIHTGTSFVNQDGVTGIEVAPADVNALAAAMQRLADDAALTRRLGDGARRHYEQAMTSERMNAGYDAIYRELANEPTLAQPREE